MRKNSALRYLLAAVVLIAACSGCQTGKNGDGADGAGLFDRPPIPFVPASGQSALRFDGGSYANLFGPGCSAIWTGPALAPAPAISGPPEAAPTLNSNFLSVECRLESTFPDISIAYDAVGLRGVSVYILTPDGRKIYPAQKISGGGLEEIPQGALRQFVRNNTLMFNSAELALVLNREDPKIPVRLMLEGFGSKYCFEWFPRLPDKMPSKVPEKAAKTIGNAYEEGKKAAKTVYGNFH